MEDIFNLFGKLFDIIYVNHSKDMCANMVDLG